MLSRDFPGDAGDNVMHCESGRVDDQVSFADHPFAGGGKLSDVVQPPLPAGHLELIMLTPVPKGRLVTVIQMIMRSTVPSLSVCPAEWTPERNTAAGRRISSRRLWFAVRSR